MVSHLVKTFMTIAGIDTAIFKTHSARSAATSAASRMGATLETIMQTAGWCNAWTFAVFYNKPLAENANFSSSLLAMCNRCTVVVLFGLYCCIIYDIMVELVA